MLLEDFSNKLLQHIRANGEPFAPFSGYPFTAIPSPVIQVLAGCDFDLCVGISVKDAAGKDFMILATQWLPGGTCLVSLIPEEVLS